MNQTAPRGCTNLCRPDPPRSGSGCSRFVPRGIASNLGTSGEALRGRIYSLHSHQATTSLAGFGYEIYSIQFLYMYKQIFIYIYIHVRKILLYISYQIHGRGNSVTFFSQALRNCHCRNIARPCYPQEFSVFLEFGASIQGEGSCLHEHPKYQPEAVFSQPH